jgi:hypothetical protein
MGPFETSNPIARHNNIAGSLEGAHLIMGRLERTLDELLGPVPESPGEPMSQGVYGLNEMANGLANRIGVAASRVECLQEIVTGSPKVASLNQTAGAQQGVTADRLFRA